MAVEYGEAILNFYEHKECGTHWVDLWSCGCNDECPKCRGEIEPYASLAVSEFEASMAKMQS
jgi:hypothetical protein